MEKNTQDLPKITAKFAGLEDNYSSFEKSKVAILPVPYDITTTYKKGTSLGPKAILDASTHMELFDEELNAETFKIGIHTMESLDSINDLKPEDMVKKVYEEVLEILKSGKFPVVIGGEHSISSGAVRAVKEIYPNVMVINFDAHYDLKDEYDGNKHSHACAARRISEICPIVEIGVRSLSKEEKEFLSTSKIKTFSTYDIIENPNWINKVHESLISDDIYLTIDLDVFDPSIMPSVGTPEPGGMGWYTFLELILEISERKNIVGFDVVELCPNENNISPDFLASKLIYRILTYIFMNKKNKR